MEGACVDGGNRARWGLALVLSHRILPEGQPVPGDFLGEVERVAEGLYLLPSSAFLSLRSMTPLQPQSLCLVCRTPCPSPLLPPSQVSLLSHHLPSQLLWASGEQSGDRKYTVGGWSCSLTRPVLLGGLCSGRSVKWWGSGYWGAWKGFQNIHQ